MVKYTLIDESKSLFASKYKLYLPTEEQLRREINKEKGLLGMEKKLKKKIR